MPLERLTKRQRDVYEFIREKIESRGYGPTVREIGTEFGIRSPNGVMCHLRALERKGLIHRTPKESRAINLRHRGLPLRGSVSADVLNETVNVKLHVDFSEMFHGKDYFALEVNDNSMISANIVSGDYVVVAPRGEASKGEMVVARTADGQATLKYWHPEKHRIRLQPANASMEPIYVKDAKVLGVVVGVVRKMSS